MALTPSDVEQKTFSTALRGYDLDEVDDFLDEVVATLRDLQDQVATAKAVAPEADEGAAVSVSGDEESVLGRVLITAQNTADSMVAEAKEEAETKVADARDEAEKILEDARTEAETWSTERDQKKAEAETEMSELAQRVASVRTQLAVLATAVADRLDEMDDAIGGATSVGPDEDTEAEEPFDETVSFDVDSSDEPSDDLDTDFGFSGDEAETSGAEADIDGVDSGEDEDEDGDEDGDEDEDEHEPGN